VNASCGMRAAIGPRRAGHRATIGTNGRLETRLGRVSLHRYNRYLLEFARHYGLAIKLCSPYRAQTKGKVERFHRYLRESFFAPLQTAQSDLVDVATANREVRIWLNETANVRLHATLKERPFDRYIIERNCLRPLPLPYAGQRSVGDHSTTYAGPIPVESLQHPLAIYDTLAREIAL
jgi:hypothetical protein